MCYSTCTDQQHKVVHTLIYETSVCDRAANGIALALETLPVKRSERQSSSRVQPVELERRWPGERKDKSKMRTASPELTNAVESPLIHIPGARYRRRALLLLPWAA